MRELRVIRCNVYLSFNLEKSNSNKHAKATISPMSVLLLSAPRSIIVFLNTKSRKEKAKRLSGDEQMLKKKHESV